MTLVKDWITITFLRIMNWLGWPTWLLVVIGVIVVLPIAVYSYFWYVARVLRSSE